MVVLGTKPLGTDFHAGTAERGYRICAGRSCPHERPQSSRSVLQDRLLRIALDAESCKGAGFCEVVYPKDVFEPDRSLRLATLARSDSCVQCGACIVQCPFDALSFESTSGDVVTPQTVRRFKLNLLGRRLVSADEAQESSPKGGSPRT